MRVAFLALALPGLAAGCGTSPTPSPDFPAADWQAPVPAGAYLLAPGDTLEVVVHSAPELSRAVTVAPDGRIELPLAGGVRAAARTTGEVRSALMQALARELRDPDLDVLATGFGSQKVFVGGEVASPGMYDLPGTIDPLQAILMAGGLSDRARTGQVVLLRRLPGGEVRSAVIDIEAGLYDPRLAGWLPLQRFDVVYVPRSRISEQNLFVQQWIRQALPIEFSLFYDVTGQN